MRCIVLQGYLKPSQKYDGYIFQELDQVKEKSFNPLAAGAH